MGAVKATVYESVYESVDEMWLDTLHALTMRGASVSSRDGDSIELLGYHAALRDPDRNFVLNPGRKLDPVYAAAELLWYLSGAQKIDMIKTYAPQYERFAEEGIAHGAYGHRWHHDPAFLHAGKKYQDERFAKDPNDALPAGHSQLGTIVELLKSKPDSRQAVVCMWDGCDLMHATWGKKKDLPCTLTFQFLLRSKQLVMITNMRSNDVWLGLPYDVFAFTCIQRLIADRLGVDCGPYIHNAGSMHYYKRDEEKIQPIINAPPSLPVVLSHNWANNDYQKGFGLECALDTEEHARTGQPQMMSRLPWGEKDASMLSDLSYLCCLKLGKGSSVGSDNIHSPILRRAWEQKYNATNTTVA